MRFFFKNVGIILALVLLQQPAHAWTISQNYDDKANSSPCGWDAAGGATVSGIMAFSGAKSCQLEVTGGTTAFGEWGGIIEHPAAVKRGGELWFRVRTFMPAGFNYNSSGEGNHLKFLRFHTRSPGTENQGYNDIYINPKGVLPPFKFIFEGEQVWSMFNNGAAEAIVLGTWETYEFYVKLDTVPASKGGMARVRFWKNGTLLADITDRKTLTGTDSFSDRTHLFTYWNGGAPKTQQMYIDDFVLTSDIPAGRDARGNPYIGVGTMKIPMAPKAFAAQ